MQGEVMMLGLVGVVVVWGVKKDRDELILLGLCLGSIWALSGNGCYTLIVLPFLATWTVWPLCKPALECSVLVSLGTKLSFFACMHSGFLLGLKVQWKVVSSFLFFPCHSTNESSGCPLGNSLDPLGPRHSHHHPHFTLGWDQRMRPPCPQSLCSRWVNTVLTGLDKTMETVTDFIFLGSKITADGDCKPWN